MWAVCGVLARGCRLLNRNWVFLLQDKKVVKTGSGRDLVGFRTCFYFWVSLFVVFWAGILTGFSLSRQ